MKNSRLQRAAVIALGFLAVALPIHGLRAAQNPPVNQPASGPATAGLGLMRNAPGAFKGYTLISPIMSTKSLLVDMEGRVVHSWDTGSTPGAYGYLLENGHLLRAGAVPNPPFGGFIAGGSGRIQEIDWNGDLVWDFTYHTADMIPHHDFVKLPNGNVLLIVKEKKTADQALAAGRLPGSAQNGLQPEALIEIKPTGKTTGEVVWEWHLWDHMIQDIDAQKANYGDVAARPGRLDINFTVVPGGRGGGTADWVHANAVAYDPVYDQLAISFRSINEIYIIDHSTTTREAAGSTGGRQGKGGDFIYRWGNPRAYRQGTADDQRSFGQHNVQWIGKGLPGAGNLLIFNNGDTRPGDKFSTIEEISLPVDKGGAYTPQPGKKLGQEQPVWTYVAPNKTDFYSNYISGAQRLPNGNTLICSGANGMVFEVTPDKQVVWQMNFPQFGAAPAARGGAGAPAPGRGGPGGAGAPPRGPGGVGGPAGGPGAAAAPARGGGGGANNPSAIFRAFRYAPDFPGLKGKTLATGRPIEEFVQ